MPIIANAADIANKHAEVAAEITVGSPGYAQVKAVEGQKVSYHYKKGFSGFWFGYPMPAGMHHAEIMDAVIFEVTAGRGEATNGTFSAKFAGHMIKSRRAFNRADKDAEAQQIETWMGSHPGVFRS